MTGTGNAIVPLSLLEAVRSVDIPEGEDVDVEYVQEHRNKRLGLSDTVIAQIRRYKDALKRNQPIAIHEASGISRLIGRRPDAAADHPPAAWFSRAPARLPSGEEGGREISWSIGSARRRVDCRRHQGIGDL